MEVNSETKTGRLKTVWQTPSCMIMLVIAIILLIIIFIGINFTYNCVIKMLTNNVKVKRGSNLNYPRYDHVQVKLDNGNIFIIGGYGKNEKVQYYPEIYLNKHNKFVKLGKTDCRYQNPKVLKNNIGNLLITETTCPKKLIFDIYTQQFNEAKTEKVENFKDIKDEDVLLDLNEFKNTEMNVLIRSEYNSINFEGFKAIKLSDRFYIFMCDNFLDIDFQKACYQSLGFDKKNGGHFFLIPKFKYSPINGKITKIADGKFILIGGSYYNKKAESVPHKHSQLIYISDNK